MDERQFFVILMFPLVFGQTPDLTTAFQQYVDACSPKPLCSTRFNVFPPLKNNVTVPAACPACDCDEKCILRGTCCPDLLFSRKAIPSCVDVTIIGDDVKKYLMVPKCSSQDSCKKETLEDRFKNVPVSSKTTGYSYENKALAEKYEKGAIMLEWGVEFMCNTSVDFNFISKYSELLETTQSENCSVKYSPNDEMKPPQCAFLGRTISRCNMTGYWEKYDEGIDWACSNLHQHSGLFENIFCHLCNPAKTSVESTNSLISVCNHTGLWQSFDKEVEEKCVSGSKSHLTYPFKNIFCWLCNTDPVQTTLYKEINGGIAETSEEGRFLYQINMTGFAKEELLKLKQMAETNATSVGFADLIWRDGRWINKTKLVRQYQATTGKSTCDKTIVFSCVCDPSCLEDLSKDCCIDFFLDFKLEIPVFKYTQYSSSQNSLAISSCAVVNVFTDKCLHPSDDFVESYPVTDLFNQKHYRNIYCFLCNKNNLTDIHLVTPWTMTINSSEVLGIQFYSSIIDVLHLASLNNQEIILSPPSSDWPIREIAKSQVNVCNKTGLWKNIDADIDWACNTVHLPYESYSNVFCKICNPRVPIASDINVCNLTKTWDNLDTNIKTACSGFPEVSAAFRYKNQFCKFCNEPSSNYLVTTTQRPKESDSNSGIASLRDIFSVFRGEEQIKCSHLQLKTKTGACWKQRCYPGKILTNDGCIPLLPITKNLNYTIHFSLAVLNNNPITEDVMQFLATEVTTVIRSILNVTNIKFHSKMKRFTTNGSSIDIESNFFVEAMIPRLRSENLLLSLRKNPKDFFQIKNVEFLEPNLTRFLYESNISSIKVDSTQSNTQEKDGYRNVIIASLITCTQVELVLEEIEIFDNIQKKIKIKNSGVILDESEYYIANGGAYVVCVDDFCGDSSCSEFLVQDADLERALRIFTLVCTIPSLLCLVATFVHYCLFKRLRTTQGIHFMALTVSLFFSQLFFQFFLRKNFQSDTGCRIMGMVIHFWWLATFFCYALNGYLMFMTFRANISCNSESKRINIRYFLFSFGIPLAIVILTFLFNFFASGDVGYGFNSVCFLNNSVSLSVSFLLIIAIICIFNTIFFTFVIYKLYIYKKQQQMLGINKEDMDMIAIFFKLFFISGLSWIFFLIDASIPEPTIFSFIVTFVNCLQGTLMFLLEVCKKKSREMYKDFKKFREQRRPRQTFSSSKRCVSQEACRRASRSGSVGSCNPVFSSIEDEKSTENTKM